jgi:hypothetical protein
MADKKISEQRKIAKCMLDILDVLEKHKLTSIQICKLAVRLMTKFMYKD